jgi:hypothetical protein
MMATTSPPRGRSAQLWEKSWLVLPLLLLPAVWPLVTGGLTQGHDLPNHLMRLAAFHAAILKGQWYPRWLPDLALGYGYPLYNYYPPGSAYAVELFRLLGFGPQAALNAYFCAALVVAGLGAWRLAADFFPARSPRGRGALALVAATAYLYSPYLLINVYLRGAIAELGAQALLPWAVWAVRGLFTRPRPARWVLPAALSMAALAVTHHLTLVLVMGLLLALSAVWLWRATDRARRLAWAVAAGAAAMGLSAFYWAPLLGEQALLAGTFAQVARSWLPDNLWTSTTFLDQSLLFRYHLQPPYPLGLAQVALAVGGLWAMLWGGRSNRSTPPSAEPGAWPAEWLVLALAAAGAAVLGGRPWQGLWLSTPLLLLQFPWRLLIVITLVTALCAAGLLVPVRNPRARGWLAVLILGLIIVTQRPRLTDVAPLPADLPPLTEAHVAQFEHQTGSLGATTNYLGSNSDFIPRWVDQTYGLTTTPAADEHLPARDMQVEVLAAGATTLELRVSTPGPRRLRLSQFYFPGWGMRLDGIQRLAPYPDTPLGLLTVDLPAGTHTVSVRWTGTALENGATAMSLLTLAALSLWAWRTSRPWAWLLAGLAGLGLAAWLHGGLAEPVPLPALREGVAYAADAVRLAGLSAEPAGPRGLTLRPYWWVAAPAPDLQFHWRLVDAGAGQSVVAEARTRPFFDTVPAASWRAGTLVEDAYSLELPAGLSAGTRLAVAVCAASAGDCEPQPVGVVVLRQPTPPALATAPLNPVDARFGDSLYLSGYALQVKGRLPDPVTGDLRLVRPGETLDYTLVWQSLGLLATDPHAFIELADAQLNIAARHDDVLGPAYWPARLWSLQRPQRDIFPLTIADDAPNGVYWPQVGAYDFATLQRLPVTEAAGRAPDDTLRFAPVKVLRSLEAKPAHRSGARFEDTATLTGYDLSLPPGALRPGARLTLTLYFRAEASSARDLTRFVHLANADNLLAAQADGPPQGGRNPTWAWVPGEVIVDVVELEVDPAAAPGDYNLRVGFYDPAAGGARLVASAPNGQPLPDGQVVLDLAVTVNP